MAQLTCEREQAGGQAAPPNGPGGDPWAPTPNVRSAGRRACFRGWLPPPEARGYSLKAERSPVPHSPSARPTSEIGRAQRAHWTRHPPAEAACFRSLDPGLTEPLLDTLILTEQAAGVKAHRGKIAYVPLLFSSAFPVGPSTLKKAAAQTPQHLDGATSGRIGSWRNRTTRQTTALV